MKLLPFVLLCTVMIAPAEPVKLGAGSYRTDLPAGPDGKPRRSIGVNPLVSENFQGPMPTNDWWSSLVWPTHSPHSMPMFPHPLAVQAHADGLGIGYTSEPTVGDHRKDGKPFQLGTDYRFPYRESLRVGLAGLDAEATLLDASSDWAVTALWESGEGELRATFAHGSPFVYFENASSLPVQIRFSSAKVDATRVPVDPYTYEWKGITGKHSGEAARFELAVNAGKNRGNGVKARLVYDFDGDGKSDRTETYQLFATDATPGSWEAYRSEKQPLDSGLSRGEWQDFRNGSVRFEFWKCFGEGAVELDLAKSRFHLPDGSTRAAGEGGTARVGEKPTGAARVFYAEGDALGVTINGSHFGVFAPAGTDLSIGDGGISAKIGYLSVAALPDAQRETVQFFKRFAYAILRDTKLDYRYDQASARVTTTYTVETEAKQDTNTETLFALYRHQHLHTTGPDRFEKFTYASPRGEMRVLAGSSFSTSIPFLGVLPALPNAPADTGQLATELERDAGKFKFNHHDTYWNGKEFGKVSELIQIAEQLGKTGVRDQLLSILKSRLENWFDGEEKYFFYYDGRWDTLTGYPDSYGSGEQLNDHHFHYSYFIKAAATIAQFDPEWVGMDRYGAMVEALIRDCANYDRGDKRFPWMRSFDPYAGHSWAAGHAGFGSGNNQESSSESMNFATSLILYGQATGRDEIRDLGIYWHSTEAEAIRHYWFDQDGEVFPAGYGHSCVGMVWGDGASYGTWWTANPEEIHGINFLPLNGGSLHLGRDPDYITTNLANLRASNRNFHNAGFPGDAEKLEHWGDILAGYQALADPEAALSQIATVGESEIGETRTHSLQWIGALRELGRFDAGVQADHPTAVAFEQAYVVFNPETNSLVVRFSDGKTIKAPPGFSTTQR